MRSRQARVGKVGVLERRRELSERERHEESRRSKASRSRRFKRVGVVRGCYCCRCVLSALCEGLNWVAKGSKKWEERRKNAMGLD